MIFELFKSLHPNVHNVHNVAGSLWRRFIQHMPIFDHTYIPRITTFESTDYSGSGRLCLTEIYKAEPEPTIKTGGDIL